MSNSLIIKLDPVYTFEGKEYKELDLSGLENYSYKQLRQAKKAYRANGGDEQVFITDDEFAISVAAQLIKQPISFFDDIDAGIALAVYTIVSNELGKKFQATQTQKNTVSD